MKRYIKAAEDGDNKYFLGLIDSARIAGYKMKVSDNMKIIITAEKDPDIMPTISAWVIDIDGDEKLYRILTKVEFPTLETEQDDDYSKTQSIINKWQKVGTFISELQEEVIDTTIEVDGY